MEDFSFAMAILQGIDISTKIQSPTKLRDPVLKHVLSLFDEKPVDIFRLAL